MMFRDIPDIKHLGYLWTLLDILEKLIQRHNWTLVTSRDTWDIPKHLWTYKTNTFKNIPRTLGTHLNILDTLECPGQEQLEMPWNANIWDVPGHPAASWDKINKSVLVHLGCCWK